MTDLLNIYNNNVEKFYRKWNSRASTNLYERFLVQIPKEAKILDAGCGPGIHTKYFVSKGYQVTAFDAAEEMVRFAQNEAGIKVECLEYDDMLFDEEFDAIWAKASLLHTPYEETRALFKKMHNALKENGIFYSSYKYGENHMNFDGRDFYNMTETTILPYLENLFDIIDIWQTNTEDILVPGVNEPPFLNFIARKAK